MVDATPPGVTTPTVIRSPHQARRHLLLFCAGFALDWLTFATLVTSSQKSRGRYARRDPADAAAQFRKVLARNSTHYGATFQLASSLDRAGLAPEARPLWENVLTMAAVSNDAETTATAQARLATRP